MKARDRDAPTTPLDRLSDLDLLRATLREPPGEWAMLASLWVPVVAIAAVLFFDDDALPGRIGKAFGAAVTCLLLYAIPVAILRGLLRALQTGRYRREFLRRQGIASRPEAAFPTVPGRKVVMVLAHHHGLGPEVIWVVLDPSPVPHGRLLQALRSGHRGNSPLLRSGEAALSTNAAAALLAAQPAALVAPSGRHVDFGRNAILCTMQVHEAGAPMRRLHGTVSTDRGTPTPAAVLAKAILAAELEQLPEPPAS